MSNRLKVTSPRMEQDVFYFTPSGRPDRPDVRRMLLEGRAGKERRRHE